MDEARRSQVHAAVEAEQGLGAWQPLSLTEAQAMFERVPFWWAVAGGWAIDLFLGAQSRSHADLDIAVSRRDHALVFQTLKQQAWDCHVAASGKLAPWKGEKLKAGENSVWCRESADAAWRFEIVMTEIDDGDWVFRRNPRVRLGMDEAITVGSPSYISPHVQMLFKARHRRAKDDDDLALVLPRLDPERRRWLHHALRTTEGPDHPWVAFTQTMS